MSAFNSGVGSSFQCVRVVRIIGPASDTSHPRCPGRGEETPRLRAHQRWRKTCRWKAGVQSRSASNVRVSFCWRQQLTSHCTGSARGRNFIVTLAFSNQREGKRNRAYKRELPSQRDSTIRPLLAQADWTQRNATAPFRRLYAENTTYQRAKTAAAQATSIRSRRSKTLL